MCRSIKTLRRPPPKATNDEIRAAALQFVRKISGYNKPSVANTAVFNNAVDDIAAAAGRLLDGLEKTARPSARSSPSGPPSLH